MKSILSELRRRNVFRVAAAYLVVGWIVMQVVSTIGSAAGLPDWADSFALIILVAGFPVVLFIAWAFELTPEGMKKTEAADTPVGFKPLGPSDYLLIAGVLVVLGVAGFQAIGPRQNSPAMAEANPVTERLDDASSGSNAPETPVIEAENTAPSVAEASIAVLPFADFSPDGDQQYFSDGIAEELLNALAQFPDLQVAARTSAFSFRGDNVDLREVGDALGVAHVLEGSVRQSGDQIRITAQLIRASDGYHLWSGTYERTLTDIFQIQDDIVRQLSRVLQVRLGVGAGAGRASRGNVDPRAYEQYLRGLNLWASRDQDNNRERAIEAFQLATENDPEFADGWAAYGISISISGEFVHGLNIFEVRETVSHALTRALELDPGNARAHAGLGWFHTYRQPDIESALAHSAHALEIAPNAAFAHYSRATVLSWAGDYDAAGRHFRRALSLDPLNATISRVFSESLASLGDVAGVERVLSACTVCDERLLPIARFGALLQSSSEEAVLEALPEFLDALRHFYGDMPEVVLERQIAVAEDYANLLLGEEGAGNVTRDQLAAAMANDNVGFDTVISLAMLGDMDTAASLIFLLYDSEELLDLDLYLLPGRSEIPELLRRHPRYHEFWQLSGMPALAAVRRSNGQTAGLPLPIEAAE
ncbi:tetratricopeptide repeat protein [Hyphobacterium sp.]|uniref:tetratricopeptide repeat protein n=1 Tax=Hyphobacterium sp. TaxID=2004662 RepID=UPI003B529008